MAYLDYPGLSYFKSLLDETYLRTSYTGDTTIAGDVTFTGDTVFSKDITGNVDGKAKKDWRGQQIDSTYIKEISTNDNVGQIVYTKGDGTSNYIIIDMMQGATVSAAGKAGLVPAPTISERTKFLRGDGEWGVPTDIYVTQNLINTNDSFPILIGATAGAAESQIGTAIAFGTKVSVNPNTHALIADHLILKHPTYRRSNNISSKVMYTLNFADSDDGNGNNLSEIYGYIDPVANGGEHELGFRLFGNPNVQGVEEIFTYLSVGLSKTNVPYGHAPSTPLPADHNEGTDIITRDWLARNGSETGLVHTSMNETIGGIKTFTDETRNTSIAGITTTKLTASGKITGTGTAEISGGSGNTPSLKVTGNETVTGDLSVGGNETVAGNETVTGNISTTNGNISTTNGTVSGKTGSIGTGGLTVTVPSNLNGKVTAGNGLNVTGNTETDTLTVNGNETVGGALTVTGKITGNNGAAISGGNGLQVTGNETVSGNLTVDGTTTTDDLSVTDDATVGDTLTVGGQVLKKTGTNTTQEYVSYITNQEGARNTIINNLIKADGGLAQDSNHNIYVKTGDGIQLSSGYVTTRLKNQGGIIYDGSTANNKSLKLEIVEGGGLKYHAYTEEQPYSGLLVDFSGSSAIAQEIANKMKEDLLSSLGMQIPLTGNKIFYVNKDSVTATEIWRNSQTGVIDKSVGTQDKPFKTIQAAVDCATQGYSIGSHYIIIKIVKSSDAGYNEYVSLPQYQHTTGYIKITSYDITDSNTYAVITNKATSNDNKSARPVGSLVRVNGSGWYIDNIKFDSEVYDLKDNISHFPHCLGAGANASVIVRGCSFNFHYKNDDNDNGNENLPSSTSVYMRMISVTSGGVVSLQMMQNYQNTVSVTKGNAESLNVFFCERQGQINFDATNDGNVDSPWHYITCNGSCSTFVFLSIGSVFSVIGGAKYLTGFNGSITGINCYVKQLSILSCDTDFPSTLNTGTKDSTSHVSSNISVS